MEALTLRCQPYTWTAFGISASLNFVPVPCFLHFILSFTGDIPDKYHFHYLGPWFKITIKSRSCISFSVGFFFFFLNLHSYFNFSPATYFLVGTVIKSNVTCQFPRIGWEMGERKEYLTGGKYCSIEPTMYTEGLDVFRLVCPGPRDGWLSPPGPDSVSSMCAITHRACNRVCSLRVPS